jgi:hypothetical protein
MGANGVFPSIVILPDQMGYINPDHSGLGFTHSTKIAIVFCRFIGLHFFCTYAIVGSELEHLFYFSSIGGIP